MKRTRLVVGSLLATCALAISLVAHTSSTAPQGTAADYPAGAEALTSLTRRFRQETSNGTIARTTILVGTPSRSADGVTAQRFVGSVTHFELQGQFRGDMASLKDVETTGAEAIAFSRSLPPTEAESAAGSPSRTGNWRIEPVSGKTWAQVQSSDELRVTFQESP